MPVSSTEGSLQPAGVAAQHMTALLQTLADGGDVSEEELAQAGLHMETWMNQAGGCGL